MTTTTIGIIAVLIVGSVGMGIVAWVFLDIRRKYGPWPYHDPQKDDGRSEDAE